MLGVNALNGKKKFCICHLYAYLDIIRRLSFLTFITESTNLGSIHTTKKRLQYDKFTLRIFIMSNGKYAYPFSKRLEPRWNLNTIIASLDNTVTSVFEMCSLKRYMSYKSNSQLHTQYTPGVCQHNDNLTDISTGTML